MLKKISIKGFKLHKETCINLTPFVVFIGPNNTGKTSLMQAIQLLCQRIGICPGDTRFLLSPATSLTETAKEKNKPFKYLNGYKLDLGEDINEILHFDMDYLSINVEGEVSLSSRFDNISKVNTQFEIKINKDNILSYHTGWIKAKDYKISWENDRMNFQSKIEPKEFSIEDVKITLDLSERLHYYSFIERPSLSYQRRTPRIEAIGKFAEELVNAPINLLKSCYFIYPLRGFEETAYELPYEKPQPSKDIHFLERVTLQDRITSLVSAIAYNPEFKRDISQKLTKILDSGEISVDYKAVGPNRGSILISQTFPSKIENILHQGSGIQQLIYILLPFSMCPENSIIFLTEPEVHLHPRAQYKLMNQLIKISKERNIQLVVETHSDHVLHSFCAAVAKREINNKDVSTYSFERKESYAKVKLCEIDEFGRISGDLGGFWEQDMEEFKEMVDALTKGR
jgi:AAA15 family ATPase/GTPase